MNPFSTRCMKCVGICPVGALNENDYPEGITDKNLCIARSEALLKQHISPCGFCIKVCPVGQDRKLYGRENTDMYDENNPGFGRFHKAWQHVQFIWFRKIMRGANWAAFVSFVEKPVHTLIANLRWLSAASIQIHRAN